VNVGRGRRVLDQFDEFVTEDDRTGRCRDIDADGERRFVDEGYPTVVLAHIRECVRNSALQILTTRPHRLFDDGGIEQGKIRRAHRVAELLREELHARPCFDVDVRRTIDAVEHGLCGEQIPLFE